MMASENRVLGKIFGANGEEIKGKLRNC